MADFISPTPRASDLTDLPRIAVGNAGDFEKIVAAGEPSVITGLLAQWPALAAGKQSAAALNDYLKALDRGAQVPVMEAPARARGQFAYGRDLREFTFTKRRAPLASTLDRIAALAQCDDAPTVAIQMFELAAAMPDFLAQNSLNQLPGIGPRLWLGGAVRTRTHNDRDHNLACVLAGRRQFLLFPPDQVSNLYIGPPDISPPLSLVDPEAPDLIRFPRFREALTAASIAILEPGDALFVPRYWWHHVASLDRYNAMVNYWWSGDIAGDTNTAFLTALLAFRDLPTRERAYWREMIASYVFAERGDVLCHLPEPLRGILGPMSAARRSAIWQQLKAALPPS